MPGTKEGGKKAAQTNKSKYGSNFYKKIGGQSWKNPNRSRKTGFAINPELAREAGRKGGLKTKDDYKTKEEYEDAETLANLLKESDPESM